MICRSKMSINVCLEVYDLRLEKGTFTGCAKLTINDKMPFEPECFHLEFPQPRKLHRYYDIPSWELRQ